MGPRVALILAVLALTLIGFVMIYSASSVSAITESGNAASYLFDQLRFAVIGLLAAFVLYRFIPYRVWAGPMVWVIWAIGVLLLVATALIGTTALGAQRWVNIGPISLQPSEFVKIALVLMAARLFSELRAHVLDIRTFLVQVLILLVAPTGFLFATQSDLGSTAIIFLGIIAVMWLGEVPWQIIVAVIVLAILFAIGATFFSPYRSDRLLYINPWNDGKNGYGNGYQIIHSFYAFAQGGIFGVGLGNSREKFLYLPESETDFIYAIIGEELGLIGAVLIILLFLVIVWAGMRIARSAPDDFGAMVAGSLTIMLVFQAFLNIGCVIGLFPTTGKPLPFVSSGGSSLIASFIMVGIILSVSRSSGALSSPEKRREELRVVRTSRARR